MAQITAYAQSPSGRVESINAVYATARTGGSLFKTEWSADARIGQIESAGSFTILEACLWFDTSGIPVGSIVTAAVLSLRNTGGTPLAPFTLEVRDRDWGATLEAADWLSGASLSSDTLRATIESTAMLLGQYYDCTDVALAAGIAVAGPTRLMVSSSDHRLGNAPAVTQDNTKYFALNTADQWPRLVVTYTPPGPAIDYSDFPKHKLVPA